MRRHATAATLVSLAAPVLLGGCQNGVAKETKQPTDPPAIVQEYDSTGAKTPTEQAINKILDGEQIPKDETSTENSSKGETSETSAEPTDDIDEITTEKSSSDEAIEETKESSSAEATKPANDKIETAETAETPAEFGLRLLEYGDDLTNDIIEKELQKYLKANSLDNNVTINCGNKFDDEFRVIADFVPNYGYVYQDCTLSGELYLCDFDQFKSDEGYRKEYVACIVAGLERMNFYATDKEGSFSKFCQENNISKKDAAKCMDNLYSEIESGEWAGIIALGESEATFQYEECDNDVFYPGGYEKLRNCHEINCPFGRMI